MSDDSSRSEILFLQVVAMFQVAAMQQMGKIPNPLTSRIERDLDQARATVDILGMLKDKTHGNLTKREEDYLGKVLFECQMNYLDELKKPDAEQDTKPEERSGSESPAGGEGKPSGQNRDPGRSGQGAGRG